MASAASDSRPDSYRFENAQLLPGQRRLLVRGEPVALGARAFDVLLALVERSERVVSRDELLDICWPGLAVEPNNIAVQIGTLRRLLGRHLIASIPGRGYQFSVAVQAQAAPAAPSAKPAHQPSNLPELPPLIGRDDDLRAVSELIRGQRLVTILGAGGIGKSRLAQHVLQAGRDAYRHGVCWVELGAISDGASLPDALAAALGANLGGGASMTAVEAALAPLDILIAFDNAEHLLAEISLLVETLGRAAADVRFLVTSQAPLQVAQEHVYQLGPLATPGGRVNAEQAIGFGAVKLFVQRARAAQAGFQLNDENVREVVALCEQLDGLPLAIELAAARVSLLSVAQIARTLHQRLEFLTGGYRNAPARQRTMAAALDWSHNLLGANEQIVFRRLAVVVGSASFELVRAIAVDVDRATPDAQGPLDGAAVIGALAALVDRSLVDVVAMPGAARERRYRLLESPRAFAAEKLAAAGEAGLIEERHARAVGDWAVQAWVDRWSGEVGWRDWLGIVEADRRNGIVALAWAKKHEAFDLVLRLAPILLNRRVPGVGSQERTDISSLLDRCLSTQPPHADQLPARLMLMRRLNEVDVQRSLAEADRAFALAQACGQRFYAYNVASWRVRLLVQMRDREAAAAALATLEALEDPAWPAVLLWIGSEGRSIFHLIYGSPQSNIDAVRRELATARLAGELGFVTASNLVDAQLLAGQAVEAATLARELVAELAHHRDEFALLHARVNLSACLLRLGEPGEAQEVLRSAWRVAKHFGMQGDCADHMSLLAAMQRRWPAAAALAGYADAAHAVRKAQRWPNELHAHDTVLRLTREALGDAEFERLLDGGRRLADVEVEGVAFPNPLLAEAVA